jgi:hypothetical protein
MDISDAAHLIQASPAFRLLRRVPAPTAWPLPSASGETRKGVFVDTETTGLDQDTVAGFDRADEVIELALLPFEYERDTGAIVSVDQDAALSAFRQPSFPIPPESAKIHGLTDEMVAGQVIDPERIKALIASPAMKSAPPSYADPSLAQHNAPASFRAKPSRSRRAPIRKLSFAKARPNWSRSAPKPSQDASPGATTCCVRRRDVERSDRAGLAADRLALRA